METPEPQFDESGAIDPVLVAAGGLQDAVQPSRRNRRWPRKRTAARTSDDSAPDDWRPVDQLHDDRTGRHVANSLLLDRRPGADPQEMQQRLSEQLRLTALALSAAEASAHDAVRDRDAAVAARQELASLVSQLSAQLDEVHLGRLAAEEATRVMAEARAATEEDVAGRLAAWSSELRIGVQRGRELVERAQQLLSAARVETGRADALATSAEQAREEQLATLAAVEHLAQDAAAAHEARHRAEGVAAEQVQQHAQARKAATEAAEEARRAYVELRSTLEELTQRARRGEGLHAQAMSDATEAVKAATATLQRHEDLVRVIEEREEAARRHVDEARARAVEATVSLASALDARSEDARRLEQVTSMAAEAVARREQAELDRSRAEHQAEEALAAAAAAASAETTARESANEAWSALDAQLTAHRAQLGEALATIRDQSALLEQMREEVLVQAEARAQLLIETEQAPQVGGRPRLRLRAQRAREVPTSSDPTPMAQTIESWLEVRPGPRRATPPPSQVAADPLRSSAAAPSSRDDSRSDPAREAASTSPPAVVESQRIIPAPAEPAEVVRRRKGGTTIELVGNVLYIWRRKNHHIFDLGSRAGQIEVVGVAGQRGWRVLFHRRGLDPVVLTGADVDAAWLTRVLVDRGIS